MTPGFYILTAVAMTLAVAAAFVDGESPSSPVAALSATVSFFTLIAAWFCQ
jgi:hypothetical protein